MGWFKRSKTIELPTSPTVYPSGLCIETEGGWWYINGKFRHRISTRRILESWRFHFIVKSTEAALAKYPKAKALGFRDGTIVRAMSDSKTYLVSQRQLRLITNPDTLDLLGVRETDIILVAEAELRFNDKGEVIS